MRTRTIIILSLFLTYYSQSFGQERINRKKLSFEKNSEIMTEAIGYSYNSTLGEWIDYENIISNEKDYKNRYNSLQSNWNKKRYKSSVYEDIMSEVDQNFISIQTKTIFFNETIYYILTVEKWDGRFEYPKIRADWYRFKQTIGYIFTEAEFKKLDKFDKSIAIKALSVVVIEDYEETKFLDLIQTQITEKLKIEKNKYVTETIFPVLKSDEGKIRFYLPVGSNAYLPDYPKYDFDKAYFETDQENFSKIFIK